MDPIQQVQEILEKLEHGVHKLENVINETLSRLPDVLSWIIDKVKEGWNLLMAKLQEVWGWIADKLSYAGDPWTLASAASTWKTQVGGITANLARSIDDSDLLVDDNWSGKGADQYRQAVPPQQDALNSINTNFAMNISAALQSLSTGILVFWGTVVVAIVSVIAGFALATGEAVTFFGIPLAPPTALAGIVAALGSLATGLIVLFNTGSSAKNSLDSTAAGVQTWPRFVTS